MELGLSLGDTSNSKPFEFRQKTPNKSLSFCMGLSIGVDQQQPKNKLTIDDAEISTTQLLARVSDETLSLLPLAPVPLHGFPSSQQLSVRPWPSENGSSGSGSRGFDVNLAPAAEEGMEDRSSPNSEASSFRVDFGVFGAAGGGSKRDGSDADAERTSSRASDEDDNGGARKKLRLSKEQSAYLEESFKEHHTLNPKQKLALARQLNLRPRQVEVWFQNRRARTKLKQTEVDCEYLKRCCETLTEENKRLHKELQELRALKNLNPFYMQLPATTLTMCPSCERVVTTNPNPDISSNPNPSFSLTRPNFYPFSHRHHSTPS